MPKQNTSPQEKLRNVFYFGICRDRGVDNTESDLLNQFFQENKDYVPHTSNSGITGFLYDGEFFSLSSFVVHQSASNPQKDSVTLKFKQTDE